MASKKVLTLKIIIIGNVILSKICGSGFLGTKDQGFWFKYHYELVEFYVFQGTAILFKS